MILQLFRKVTKGLHAMAVAKHGMAEVKGGHGNILWVGFHKLPSIALEFIQSPPTYMYTL